MHGFPEIAVKLIPIGPSRSAIIGGCMSPPNLLPRLIRLRDAPRYLGMDKNRFNREVRPRVKFVQIGTQGVAFDRLELDAWADDYVRRNGRHPAGSKKSESARTRQTAKSHRARCSLARRQTHPVNALLREHWNEQARRRGSDDRWSVASSTLAKARPLQPSATKHN
jgi:hypothetical protein